MFNQEKYSDNNASTTISNTGDFYLLNGIAEGSDNTQRVGRRITPTHADWKRTIENTSSTDTVREILFVDYQADGATPTTTTLLASANPLAHYNFDQLHRFEILSDNLVEIGGSNWKPLQSDSFSDQVAGNTVYEGTGATVASITTGAIYLFYISTRASTTSLTLYTRVTFYDQ